MWIPQDLEAHVVIDVIWLRCFIIVQHYRLTTTKRLYDHFIYFFLQQFHIDICFIWKILLIKSFQGSFTTNPTIIFVGIKIEFWVLLVDSIVG